jgi:hypothetical protein
MAVPFPAKRKASPPPPPNRIYYPKSGFMGFLAKATPFTANKDSYQFKSDVLAERPTLSNPSPIFVRGRDALQVAKNKRKAALLMIAADKSILRGNPSAADAAWKAFESALRDY